MTPPFSAVSKSCDPPSVPPPLPPANFWQVPKLPLRREGDKTDSYIKPLKRREGEGVIQRYIY